MISKIRLATPYNSGKSNYSTIIYSKKNSPNYTTNDSVSFSGNPPVSLEEALTKAFASNVDELCQEISITSPRINLGKLTLHKNGMKLAIHYSDGDSLKGIVPIASGESLDRITQNLIRASQRVVSAIEDC